MKPGYVIRFWFAILLEGTGTGVPVDAMKACKVDVGLGLLILDVGARWR
jgi:hypothetical protein